MGFSQEAEHPYFLFLRGNHLGCLFHSKPNDEVTSCVDTKRGINPRTWNLCCAVPQIKDPSLIRSRSLFSTLSIRRLSRQVGQTKYFAVSSLITLSFNFAGTSDGLDSNPNRQR